MRISSPAPEAQTQTQMGQDRKSRRIGAMVMEVRVRSKQHIRIGLECARITKRNPSRSRTRRALSLSIYDVYCC